MAKHPTVIEDGVFIGSDSQLIAPVTVGKDAYVGPGSSITEDVPAGSLAIARGRQVVKPEWAAAKKAAQKAAKKAIIDSCVELSDTWARSHPFRS